MRVLIVSTSYPSVRAPHNGVFIRENALELTRRGFDVTVLAPRVFAEDATELHDAGVRVVRFGFLSEGKLLTEYDGIPVFRTASYLASGVLAARRLVRAWRPDVVHGHWVIPTGLIAVLGVRLSRSATPVVVTAHRKDVVVALGGSRIARSLARYTLARAKRIIAVSHVLAETLVRDLGAAGERVDVVPMGVDTRAFAPGDRAAARERLGIAADARLALFVGGLIPVKGVRDLIAAMPQVLPGDERVLLAMAGHGPLAAELAEQAAAIGQAARVRLLGAVEHDELPTWMNAADVLVLPSESEGLPVCLMEAAAVGLPMVATEVDGNPEVLGLDPAANQLVAPHDVPGLAAALTRALERPPAAARASMLAPGSRFTLEGSLAHLTRVYRELAGVPERGDAPLAPTPPAPGDAPGPVTP